MGIIEGAKSLFNTIAAGRYCGYNTSLCLAAQGVLQDTGELAFSVRDMPSVFRQSSNHSPQGQQTLIYHTSLLYLGLELINWEREAFFKEGVPLSSFGSLRLIGQCSQSQPNRQDSASLSSRGLLLRGSFRVYESVQKRYNASGLSCGWVEFRRFASCVRFSPISRICPEHCGRLLLPTDARWSHAHYHQKCAVSRG